MKVFSATYTDIIKFNRKPNEDFFLISKKRPIFALADGVTQSRFEDGAYAYPAGARAAAQIFCQSVVERIEEKFPFLKEIGDKKIIENAFDFANQRIWELNKQEGMAEKLDYVVCDYFDTVGVAGFMAENKLFYGYVGDCGLAVFDKNDKLRFQTKDRVEPAVERGRAIYGNWDELPQNERTKIFHRDFRNNPSGNGYGSFTGEPGVKKYYEINSLVPKPRDLIIFYSDGFVDYLKFPEFIKILRAGDKEALDSFTLEKAKENSGKLGTDRTFISLNCAP